MGKEKRSRKERSRTPEVQWENLPLEPVKAVKKSRHEEIPASRSSRSPNPRDGPGAVAVATSVANIAPRPDPPIDTAAAREAEQSQWRALVVRLAALHGDAKVESLVARKHPELSGIALECGAAGARTLSLEQAREKARPWFERCLRGCNRQGPAERAGLCAQLADSLKAHAGALRASNVETLERALQRGQPDEEGPLICVSLASELEGSRFEGLWISREGSGGAYLLGDDHEGTGLPALDEDRAPIAPRIRVLVKVISGKLVVDSFYHTGETTLNPARVPIGPFLSVYFEGASLKDALVRWKGGPPRPPPGTSVCFAAPFAALRAASSATTPRPGAPGPVSLAPVPSAPLQDESIRALSAKLPPGWEIRESRSKKGVFFYANPAKGLSQMERPTA